MKCRLASISSFAPAQHVRPNGATSITAMTNPYLSGRWDYLEIDMGMGSMMLIIAKWGEPPQIHITV